MRTFTTTRPARRLLTAAVAGVLVLAACGDDDNDEATAESPAPAATEADAPATDPPATDAPAEEPEPPSTEEMDDEAMTDEEMADDMAATDGLLDELTAAGLSAEQASCVVDTASDEWGAEALLAAGSATDDQLVRLAEITFGCIA